MRSMNDIDIIETTIKSILKQSFKDFEILNVDSGSTDGTFEIVKKYNPDNSYQIKAEDYVPGKVLNNAIKKCRGDIIVFNNSDCIPLNDNWLEALIKPLMSEGGVVASFGNQVPRKNARPLVVKDNVRAFGDGKISSGWRHFFSLATSAARKSVLEQYPFNPDIQYSEDIEWSYRIKQMGLKIQYVPEAMVEHSHNYTLEEVKKRFFNEGLADGQIYKEGHDFFAMFAKPLLVEILRDSLYLLKRGAIFAIPYGVIYRFIQKYSYYKGRISYDNSKKE
jgi:rhamnosyltransferase